MNGIEGISTADHFWFAWARIDFSPLLSGRPYRPGQLLNETFPGPKAPGWVIGRTVGPHEVQFVTCIECRPAAPDTAAPPLGPAGLSWPGSPLPGSIPARKHRLFRRLRSAEHEAESACGVSRSGCIGMAAHAACSLRLHECFQNRIHQRRAGENLTRCSG